jgi:hypothetical protein
VNDSWHRLAEARSIAYHRRIAEMIREEPERLTRVIAKLRRQVASNDATQRHWARAWLAILEQPLEDALAFLTDPGERANELRQSTPFAGLLPPRLRWQIHEQVRADWLAQSRDVAS